MSGIRSQVRLANGGSKVTVNSAADAERLLAALTKHEKELGLLQVTKAWNTKPRKRKASAKRKRKTP
jgi:leucyl aminopeptidase (aminopeptidase T)